MAARWRREPRETGLRGIVQGTRGYELREDGKRVVMVSFASKRHGHNDKWYWYGMGRNTLGVEMFDTPEEAKAHASAAYKEHKKRSETQCLSSQAGKG